MTKRKVGKGDVVSPAPTSFTTFEGWRSHFLPNVHVIDGNGPTREDPEQLAVRLVKETLESFR